MGYYPRLYNPGPIEPVVDPGQNILTQQASGYDLYRVEYVEPLTRSPQISINLANGTALVAGASTQNVSLETQLDMPSGQLGHFRFHPIDDLQYYLYEPQSLGRGTDLNQLASFNLWNALNDKHDALTEAFIFQQQRVYIRAYNYTNYTVNYARLVVYGFRYVLSGSQGEAPPVVSQSFPSLRHFNTLADALNSGSRFTLVPIAGSAG